MAIRPEDIRAVDVSFLPIVAEYVKKLGIVDEVNRLCPTMSDVSAGQIVMALILDTLSGRSRFTRLNRVLFIKTWNFCSERISLQVNSTMMRWDAQWMRCSTQERV